jgi:hypothetical protein
VLLKRRFWEQIDDSYYFYENRYDVFTEREILEVKVFEDGILKKRGGYNIRLYSFPEIEKMLTRYGFSILKSWGDYGGNPYSVHSNRLILLSKKIN